MNLEFWYLLPISIVFATIAMASGVEGATFFTPLFIIGIGLTPEIAIGTGLITEVFGFGSGLFAYTRKRLIDYKLGISLLIITIPLSLFGTWLAMYIPADILKTILGMGLLTIAFSFLRNPDKKDIAETDVLIQKEYGTNNPSSCINTASGEEICYTVCNKTQGRMIAGLGGLFIGMISTGLGELNGYFLLQRCKVPSRVAVATSVFVVSITALIASFGHIIKFTQAEGDPLTTVLSLIIFTVPGVIIGGQLGPMIASRISQQFLEKGLAVLFIIVSGLMFWEVILR